VNMVLKQFDQMNKMVKQFADTGKKGKKKFKRRLNFPFTG